MTKRRTRGDGGLYQRHDHATCPPLDPDGTRPVHRCRGRWVGTLDVWVDGRKRRKSVYSSTQKGARIELARALRERDAGTLVVGSVTVASWMHHWLDSIASRKLKPQTLAAYRSKTNTLIIPHLGKYRLTALRPEHVRAWHDLLRHEGGRGGKPLAEGTVRQAHAILGKALKVALHERKIGSNPLDFTEAPGTEQAKRPTLTLVQAEHLLGVVGFDARWILAVFYGLRQGEALGLQWRDVDTDARALNIVRTLQRDGKEYVYGTPKTKAAVRPIPLTPVALMALRLHKPAGVADDAPVFCDETGQPVRPWNDNRAWHDLLDKAGLPSMPLHSARRTAASVLEAAGVPERMVMQILGHTQVATTRRYTDAELSRVRDAFESAAELVVPSSLRELAAAEEQPE